ncbi:MAG: tetratricopeptide repeat protein [Planctomycetota bacterium]|jgi:TolB-like protein
MSEPVVSIAVLPFENVSPDDGLDYFARGFTEDLITCLTRFGPLRVTAAQSSLRIDGLDQPIEEIASAWGLDVVLEGSVRRAGDQLRVTARLVTVVGRETVWSEQFDAPLEEVFAIQDEIAGTVAGKLAVRVDDLHRTRRRRSESLAAYDLWLQGMDCLGHATLEGDAESRDYFRQALEIDGRFARAHAGLSLSHFNEWSCQAWHLWDESEENAFSHAARAVELDDSDAMVQAVLARVYRFRDQHELADACAQRALRLNPNDAQVLIQVAITTLFGGEPAAARGLVEKAMNYNPLHGAWYHGIAGWCLFMEGRFDEALVRLAQGGDAIVNFAAYRAACHLECGDPTKAERAYEDFERQYRQKIAFGRLPESGEALRWAIQVEPFRELADNRRMPDVLTAAGFTEIDVDEARRSRPSAMVRPAGIVGATDDAFVREGDVWTLEYEGAGARLVELKGFHDIARLLAEPGVSIHCLELSGAPPETDAPQAVLDAQARAAYRGRIEEAQTQLEQAERDNDVGRVEALRSELEAVADELMRATGMGGRSRVLGGRAERARSTVTWRIRSAIKKIRVAHPRLGQHLANSIKTGTFCVYAPETPVSWRL